MASEIHEIEIARRLSSGTHLFIPPLTWNLATVGSAAHLVNLIQQSGREAKIVAHPDWVDCIPETWPESLWVYPEELNYEFQDRPQWTWLWGLGHTKQHSQELNNFLLGLDSIQILDWTNDRVRRRGQFYHDCGYLGGLIELSFILSRDLWPVYNWDSCCLGDALRFYMQQYPMICLDAPIIHMAGQLEWSKLEAPDVPELAELRRHENWSVQVYKNLSLLEKQALQLYGMSLYQKDSSENLLLVLEDELGRSDFQILTPHVDLELKLRKSLLASMSNHSLGGFDVAEVDALMTALEEALGLSSKEINKVKPWPSRHFSGDHLSFTCRDPQWEIERDNRLHTDEVIEEEEPEEEEDELVNETFDWDANLLIQRLKHLKLPTLKLTRKDLVVAHLPVLRLEDQDLKETQDRIEAEHQAELQQKMQDMLDAKEEQAQLERERLEAERRLQEIEADKLRQAEAAQVQAEAERLAEEERQAHEALAEQERLEEEERQAAAERLEIETLEKEQAEQEQERARREAPQDDYLHSEKDGWGAEEEKDESEELLESFQQLDRDHPVDEKDPYDEEEKLDDSMGIEHPSYEMFEEEEDDDEQDLLQNEDDEKDFEPEELLQVLDPDKEPESEVQQDLKPEEIIEKLEVEQKPVVQEPLLEAEAAKLEIEEEVDQTESTSEVEEVKPERLEEVVHPEPVAEPAEIKSEEIEKVVEPEVEVLPIDFTDTKVETSAEPETELTSDVEEACMSPEEIMDKLEDHIEIVDLDPSTVIDEEEQPDAAASVEPPAVDPPEMVDHDPSTVIDEEEPPVTATSVEPPAVDPPEIVEPEPEEDESPSNEVIDEKIEFEPEAADVSEVYINKAEFEVENEDGALYEYDLDETLMEEEETTQLNPLETAADPVVAPKPEPVAIPSVTVQTQKVIGRETPTGYINPYLWDHHDRVNDLLSEVRQEKRLRKSDLAYVAIVALVLVWAHLNQLPFI